MKQLYNIYKIDLGLKQISTHTNKDKMDFLAQQNKHERDADITFLPGPHKYTIKGQDKDQVDYTSVTKWNHSHFAEFDADAIIINMMKGKNWPKSKYFGQTPEQIKAGWNQNGEEAADGGDANALPNWMLL